MFHWGFNREKGTSSEVPDSLCERALGKRTLFFNVIAHVDLGPDFALRYRHIFII